MRDLSFAPRCIEARRFYVPFCLTVLAMGCIPASAAEEFEQHHAHEHGKVTLNVAVSGTALVVELDAPAANVVGFEHAPKDDAERAAAAAIAKYFQQGNRLFGVPASARCLLERSELTEPRWAPPAHGAASHSDEHEQHADYEARFTYQCAEPKALTWFEPWLLDRLVHVTEMQVNLITPSGQRSEVAKSAHARLSLR